MAKKRVKKAYLVSVPFETNSHNFGGDDFYAIGNFESLSATKKEASQWAGVIISKRISGNVVPKEKP